MSRYAKEGCAAYLLRLIRTRVCLIKQDQPGLQPHSLWRPMSPFAAVFLLGVGVGVGVGTWGGLTLLDAEMTRPVCFPVMH